MAVIMLVALIVIGPKDLPRVARNVGRWVGKGRALAREFQNQLEEMAREAELDKVKQEIERAGRGDIGKKIEKTIDPTGELGKAFDPNAKSDKPDKGDKPDTAKEARKADEPDKTSDGDQGKNDKTSRSDKTDRRSDGNGDASKAQAPSTVARPPERVAAEARQAERETLQVEPG
jgi:sec-independent protein translocase protein TatB